MAFPVQLADIGHFYMAQTYGYSLAFHVVFFLMVKNHHGTMEIHGYNYWILTE